MTTDYKKAYETLALSDRVSLRERIAMAVLSMGWYPETADAIFNWIEQGKKPKTARKPKRTKTILEGLGTAPPKRKYVKKAAYWKPKKKKK